MSVKEIILHWVVFFVLFTALEALGYTVDLEGAAIIGLFVAVCTIIYDELKEWWQVKRRKEELSPEVQ